MSSGPLDLPVFTNMFVWSQSGFSVTVGGTFLLQSPSCCPPTVEMWEEKMPVKTGREEQMLGVFNLSPHPLLLDYELCLS